MRLLLTMTLLFYSLTCIGQFGSSMCECNSNMDVYRYVYEESSEVVFDSMYTSITHLLDFIGSYGEPSPNVLDLDNDGIVTVNDLLQLLEGFGNVYSGPFNYCDVTIDFVNSHGWPSSYPEAWFVIVHTSLFDEDLSNGDGWQICPVYSVWIEVVYFNHPEIPDHIENYYMR